MSRLAIINQSKRVSDLEVQRIAYAMKRQFATWCRLSERRTPQVQIARRAVAPVGYTPMLIVDNPDVAQALGYHDVDPQGRPFSKVFVDPILDNGGSVLGDKGDPSFSVSGCATHEGPEWDFDPACNDWSDNDVVAICKEVCDPVQADAFPIPHPDGTRIWVSNVVLPAWFNPLDRTGPWDVMGVLTAPFTMSRGGYWLERSEGRIRQHFADSHKMMRQAGDIQPNPGRGNRTAIRLARQASTPVV